MLEVFYPNSTQTKSDKLFIATMKDESCKFVFYNKMDACNGMEREFRAYCTELGIEINDENRTNFKKMFVFTTEKVV